MMADFDDGRAPTQEELEQMFTVPTSKGELMPQDRPPPGRPLASGAELLITEAITARKVEVTRNEPAILQKLAAIAAFAGNEVLTYRWPVKNRRTGKVDTVTGPTIKCAYAIAREYKNSRVDIAHVDLGNSWIFKAVFVDFENGVQTARLFQQHKGVAKIGGDDDARRLDMSFQIGQSKAIRNVIVAHLELPYVNYMLEVADEKLVEKIGRNIDKARPNIAKQLDDAGIQLARVERIVGKALANWTAPEIAKVWQELKGVLDGMSIAEDVWPIEAPPEPRRTDQSDTAAPGPHQGAAGPAAASPSAAHPTADQAAGAAVASTATPQSAQEPPPPTNSEVGKPASAHVAGETTEGPSMGSSAPSPRNWTIPPNIVGQDNIIRALGELLDLTETDADQDEFERQNAERISRITGTRGAEFKRRLADKRLQRTQGGGGGNRS